MRCGEGEPRDLTYQRRRHTALRCSAPGPENGEIEYGGLPVSHSIFAILLGYNVFDCPMREDARAV